MRHWIQAARPKTLIASISPVLIGAILAKSTGFFSFLTFLFTLLTAIGIQVATNFANDYFDFLKGADTKNRLGPQRVVQAGLVTLKAMKKALICVLLITLLLGLYLVYIGGPSIGILLILTLFLAVMYTKGRFAIAYLGLGELFVFIFFGPIAVAVTYYLQTGFITGSAIVAGIGPGAFSSGIILINNLRDEKEDRAAHKKTLVVRFGRLFGKCLYVVLMGVATLSPLIFYKEHTYVCIASLTAILAGWVCTKVWYVKNEKDYNPFLGETAQLLLLYTLIFCTTWIL